MAMLDLVAFVTARLADQERVALACDGVRWFSSMETEETLPVAGVYAVQDDRLGCSDQPLVASVTAEDAAAHIAMNDPASTLRSVAADQAVLDLYEQALDEAAPAEAAHTHALEQVVLRIAARWRDHPEYLQQWAQ